MSDPRDVSPSGPQASPAAVPQALPQPRPRPIVNPIEPLLSRPPTRFELIGWRVSRALPWVGLVGAALALLFGIVVGVPAFAAARSPAYRAARNLIEAHHEVQDDIGPVNGCARIPSVYRFEGDRVFFSFEVYGELGLGTAWVTVKKNDAGEGFHVVAADFWRGREDGRKGVSVKRTLVKEK